MRASGQIAAVMLLILLLAVPAHALSGGTESGTIRLGVLQFGTVNWELDVIDRHQLAQKHDLVIETVPLASTQALLTALQGRAVDVIVGDWIWAARQGELGRDYSFFPYSSMAATVVTAANSSITTFEQLRGRRIGVAGGPVNKSWILYRAYARKLHGLDLQRDSKVRFAAPPILNQLLLRGELDAVINFWHFSSELIDQGLQPILNMGELLDGMGIASNVPLLGWLFHRDWAESNRDILDSFLKTSYSARELLRHSDAEWIRIRPMADIQSNTLRRRLRDDYRSGIPSTYGEVEVAAIRELFSVLRQEGGQQLAGRIHQLPDDLFWKSSVLESH